jgi:hypothetical protein
MVLRTLFPATLLLALGSLSGCAQYRQSCTHCHGGAAPGLVALGQPVATTSAPAENASGWTCQVTLFDRPNVALLDHLQNFTLLQRPVAGSAMLATASPRPAPAAGPNMGMVAQRDVPSWLTPPQPDTDPGDAVTVQAGQKVELPPPSPPAGVVASSPAVSVPEIETGSPIRRAVRRALGRLYDAPANTITYPLHLPNAERIEKMPREVEGADAAEGAFKPVSFTVPGESVASTSPWPVSVHVYSLEESIQEGTEGACLIQVTNDGTEPVRGITLWAECAANLRPTSVLNAPTHVVDGQRVKVALAEMAPGGTRIIRVNARAVKSGDAKIAITLTAQSLEGSVLAEQALNVHK